MNVYEDHIQVGRQAAEDAFAKLVADFPEAGAVERAAYVYGMQSFCRRQLKHELFIVMEQGDVDPPNGGHN